MTIHLYPLQCSNHASPDCPGETLAWVKYPDPPDSNVLADNAAKFTCATCALPNQSFERLKAGIAFSGGQVNIAGTRFSNCSFDGCQLVGDVLGAWFDDDCTGLETCTFDASSLMGNNFPFMIGYFAHFDCPEGDQCAAALVNDRAFCYPQAVHTLDPSTIQWLIDVAFVDYQPLRSLVQSLWSEKDDTIFHDVSGG